MRRPRFNPFNRMNDRQLLLAGRALLASAICWLVVVALAVGWAVFGSTP